MSNINSKQKHFLHSLLNNKMISNDEIKSRLDALGLPINDEVYRVACVYINYSSINNDIKDITIEENEILINTFLSNNKIVCYSFIDEFDRIIVLFKIAKNYETIITKLKDKLVAKCGLDVYIGIGSEIKDISKAYLSKDDAVNMLSYRYQYYNSCVINADNIYNFENKYRSIETANNKFLDSFYIGDLSLIEKTVNEIVEDIRYTPNVSKSSIRRKMIELTVSVLDFASNNNINTDEILNGRDPYTWIINQKHTEVIVDWFLKLCGKVIASLNNKDNFIEDILIGSSKKYIEDNLHDNSLGLQMVAKHCNLSTSYFSRFFKNKTGVGINEYIANTRITKAKYLLDNTDLSINNISAQLGFRSISYFSQLFIKKVGISPSDYRKQKI